jgi:hypothetical protein
MKFFKITTFLLLALSVSLQAAFVAVLETGTDPGVKNKVSLSDRQYLTNVLREQAVKELPASNNFTIMTRENITAMLPPDKSIEDCEGSCIVETGKNIAADYICQARVSSFNGNLTLSAELYETAGNKLIASFNGLGTNLNGLLNLIIQKSPAFFRSIKDNEVAVNKSNNKTPSAINNSAGFNVAQRPSAPTNAKPQAGYEYVSYSSPAYYVAYSPTAQQNQQTSTKSNNTGIRWRRVGFFLHGGIKNAGLGLKIRFSQENGVYMTLDTRWLSYDNINRILFPMMIYLGGNYVHFITGSSISMTSDNGVSSSDINIPIGLNCDIGRHFGMDALYFAGPNNAWTFDFRFVF